MQASKTTVKSNKIFREVLPNEMKWREEYSKICRAIRKKIKANIDQYIENLLIKALESNIRLKKGVIHMVALRKDQVNLVRD